MRIARGVYPPRPIRGVRTPPPFGHRKLRAPRAQRTAGDVRVRRGLYLRLAAIRVQDALDAFWRVIPR